MLPLSPETKSGKLITEIERELKNEVSFYKTNLVKCLPLCQEKIRYPVKREMDKCFPNLQYELEFLQPSLVFLLGKQVANYVLKSYGINEYSLSDIFEYQTFEVNGIIFIPIHHPSYILIYKRKLIGKYVQRIRKIIETKYRDQRRRNSDTLLKSAS